ncbi:MAG: efflux RND transporter permease subunit [Paludibaculum sp.]
MERFFEGLLHLYDLTLQVVLRFRRATLAVSFVVLIITGSMFIDIPKGFIPDQDTDQMLITTEAAQGTSYYQMVNYQQAIAEEVQADPNVDSLVSSIGGTTSTTLGGPNFGQMIVHLKPRHQRKMLVNEVIDTLRPKLTQVPRYEGVPPESARPSQVGGQFSTAHLPVVHAVARTEGRCTTGASAAWSEMRRDAGL